MLGERVVCLKPSAPLLLSQEVKVVHAWLTHTSKVAKGQQIVAMSHFVVLGP
jgi:hypothetical protein